MKRASVMIIIEGVFIPKHKGEKMYHALGALVLLIGIIVLIKYIMRTSETKKSCSVSDETISSSEETKNDDEVAEVAGIEIDIKDQK